MHSCAVSVLLDDHPCLPFVTTIDNVTPVSVCTIRYVLPDDPTRNACEMCHFAMPLDYRRCCAVTTYDVKPLACFATSPERSVIRISGDSPTFSQNLIS